MLMQSAKPLGELEDSHEFVARHIGVSEADQALMLQAVGAESRRALMARCATIRCMTAFRRTTPERRRRHEHRRHRPRPRGNRRTACGWSHNVKLHVDRCRYQHNDQPCGKTERLDCIYIAKSERSNDEREHPLKRRRVRRMRQHWGQW